MRRWGGLPDEQRSTGFRETYFLLYFIKRISRIIVRDIKTSNRNRIDIAMPSVIPNAKATIPSSPARIAFRRGLIKR